MARILFEKLRVLTNQRLTISNKIKDIRGNVLLGKSEKLDEYADYFEKLLNKNAPLQLDDELLDPEIHVVEITLLPNYPLPT